MTYMFPVYQPGGESPGEADSVEAQASQQLRFSDVATDVLDALGECTVVHSGTKARYVERIGVGVSPGTADVTVYIGSIALSNIIDYVSGVAKAVADEYSPIYVPPGADLLIVFTGGAAAANIGVRIQYVLGA